MTRLPFLVAGLMIGCTNAWTIVPVSPDELTLEIVDEPDRLQFSILLTSSASKEICLSREGWPSRGGHTSYGTEARLVIDNGKRTIAAREVDFGYCPGGCGTFRLKEGETLEGHILYESFGDVDSIRASEDRRLEFKVTPYYCRSQN